MWAKVWKGPRHVYFGYTAALGLQSGPNALDNETFLSASATDFFRAKGNENLPENYKNNLFSQMIESALVRSATLESEDGGEDQENKNDYSYFDVKMLRNWAGPSYWKFPAFRKIQMKQRVNEKTEKDGPFDVDVDLDEDGVAVKAEATDGPVDRSRKGSSAGVDKKAVMIDFFGEAPDMTKLKAPKSPVTLEVTKGNLKKQEENAQDLVLPVDTHIQVDLFFRHFLKEKPRFFKKRVPGVVDWAGAVAIKNERGDGPVENENEGQPFTYNEDSVGFEGGFDEDEEDGSSGLDDPGSQSLYSMEGLVQADRVVEKIGVHYERFAKRVDVKKLKGSIWEHLEKKVVPSPDDASSCRGAGVVEINDCGKRARESETDGVNAVTTFGSVVETVAGKVHPAAL
ncbi:hypothetical protein PsorP6_005512 [Peronosclerospora sorghi]|uniref:Uncharacterized protein n=1 Tax=Peronosclerospora sorghi TaxID=230839 RepID=A0ACC0W2S2_9STRA|nr:hypothetical protein PsorP6_005512 [Peronosclerospora sorghi]